MASSLPCSRILITLALSSAFQKKTPPNPFPHYTAAQEHLTARRSAGCSRVQPVPGTGPSRPRLRHRTDWTPGKSRAALRRDRQRSAADAHLRMEHARVLFNRAQFLQAKQESEEAARLDPQNPEDNSAFGSGSLPTAGLCRRSTAVGVGLREGSSICHRICARQNRSAPSRRPRCSRHLCLDAAPVGRHRCQSTSSSDAPSARPDMPAKQPPNSTLHSSSTPRPPAHTINSRSRILGMMKPRLR